MFPMYIKLTFIEGFKGIVQRELRQYSDVHVIKEDEESFHIEFFPNFKVLENLKSVLKISIVKEGKNLNPTYISNHKSILGELIEITLKDNKNNFKTFKLSCAGSDSSEVIEIRKYIQETYKLAEDENADLKINISKNDEIWEVGAQLTARPLSLRDYKVENIKGGMNPTIAYAVNTLCSLDSAKSYLNIFSGSATLLIEAGLLNPKLKFLGFDKDKKSNSLAIQNITKAGLIRSIQIKTADIFEKPDFGKFDVITSDLPFGMLVSKDDDLEKVYQAFVEYCENALNPGGKLVVYTSEHELLKKVLLASKFTITNTLKIKFLTSVNAYLTLKIFVCKIKEPA